MPSIRKVLPAAVCALFLASGSGTALAQKPKHPTRAEVRRYERAEARLWSEAVYTNAVNLDLLLRTVDWDNASRPAPAAPIVVSAPVQRTPRSVAPTPVASGGGRSCTGGPISQTAVQHESGGNPAAVNPSSGAFGCWQLLPSTASSLCGIGPGSSVDQQRACADKVMATQGRGAWTASG